MQVISLFSGIGGFEIASEWMGWKNISSCEINPFCQKILKHYWPNSYHHDDVKTIDYEEIKKRLDPNEPTIVVGGFPCQPYSTAGKRLGKADERHLWPYCVRTVQQIRPQFCVFENVRGLTNWNGGVVFDEVQADLEAEGYEVLPFLLPACAVNAPHRRDRIWFIAYCNGNRGGGDNAIKEVDSRGVQERMEERHELTALPGNGATTNADVSRLQRRKNKKKGKYSAYGNAWNFFPTQSAICHGDDGIPERLDIDAIPFKDWREESIKAAGNAVVPQLVYEIFKAIESFNQQPPIT